jgi:hypothetical protein
MQEAGEIDERWAPWSPGYFTPDETPGPAHVALAAAPLPVAGYLSAGTELRSAFSEVHGHCSALYDVSGRYRYRISYVWDPSRARVCFVTLHASAAPEARPDPITEGCLRFARAWGYGAAEIVSLFAYRTTNAAVLHSADNAVGPGNDNAILAAAGAAHAVVAAWGTDSQWPLREEQVRSLLRSNGITLHGFGVAETPVTSRRQGP